MHKIYNDGAALKVLNYTVVVMIFCIAITVAAYLLNQAAAASVAYPPAEAPYQPPLTPTTAAPCDTTTQASYKPTEPPTTAAPYKPTEPPTTAAPYKPTEPPTTAAPYQPPTTAAPYQPPSTAAPYQPPTTAAPYQPPTTAAPYQPPSTAAPYQPPTTAAPYQPPSTAAPYQPPTTAAPYQPPTTEIPYQPSLYCKETCPAGLPGPAGQYNKMRTVDLHSMYIYDAFAHQAPRAILALLVFMVSLDPKVLQGHLVIADQKGMRETQDQSD